MENNKEIMQQMLQDVVTHFSENPKELRSIDNNKCLYNPPANKPNSIGCALGMYINTKNAKKLDTCEGSAIWNIWKKEKNKKLLPKWMQKIDIGFLTKLQNLHDCNNNWTDDNITKEGKSFVKGMCKAFKLDYNSIQFKKK